MIYELGKFQTIWRQLCLEIGPDGFPFNNLTNIRHILQRSPSMKDLAWYDPGGKAILTLCPRNAVRIWTKTDDINLTLRIEKEFGIFRVSRALVARTVRHHAWLQSPPAFLIRAVCNDEL